MIFPTLSQVSDGFMEKLLGQSFIVVLLVFGIIAVGKMLLKQQDRANAVQDARISDLKDQMRILEDKSLACEKDRARLWEHIIRLDPSCKCPTTAPIIAHSPTNSG